MASERRGRAAFILNATISVSLLGLVAAVALVVKSPAPPGIAEFAPQAARPITKAPLNQSGTNGAGLGACVAGTDCPSHSPSPKPSAIGDVTQVIKGVPSALQCYTWPDGSVTQTFDPQSPPCVATWPDADKGNGAVTSQGVTASTVRIAYPRGAGGASQYDKLKPLVDFFNTRYQLYGRTLELVPFTSQQIAMQSNGSDYGNPQAQHADAVQAASLNVFAATDFLDFTPISLVQSDYLDTLAQHHVISAVGGYLSPLPTSSHFAAHAPYEWTYYPALDEVFAATGSAVCSQLVGHAASRSISVTGQPRKLAIMLPDRSLTHYSLDALALLQARLAGCGQTNVPVVYFNQETSGNAVLTAKYRQLKSDGVTTILLMPWLTENPATDPEIVARNASFRPEWMTIGWCAWCASYIPSSPNSESASTFGVGSWNKLSELSSMMWHLAYEAGGGRDTGAMIGAEDLYHSLLLLASGIQMAGPKLTPQTFAAAMHSIQYPNPGSGDAPIFQASVGFPGAATSMVRDYNEHWFDQSGNGKGLTDPYFDPWYAFCYVGAGRRFTVDNPPSSDEFYRGRCR